MKLSSQIKPVSYLKAYAAEIVRTLVDQREPLISLGASTPRQHRQKGRITRSTSQATNP